MPHRSGRRSFLRGQFCHSTIKRPPGAVDAEVFANQCTKCNACIDACPELIILRDEDGLPQVDLRRGACTFCGVCARACKPQAILPASGWDWRAHVTNACLSLQGVTCRTCEDQCDNQAISFKLMAGGKSEPQINNKLCNGCGACAAACPTGAVSFYETQQHSEEKPC